MTAARRNDPRIRFLPPPSLWPLAALLLFGADVAGAAPDARFESALALYRECRYSAARELFEAAAPARADDIELDFYRGRLALWFDDEPRALACLERAARAAPRDARIQNALGDAFGLAAQRSSIFSKLGWGRKCEAAYARAVELEPDNADYHWSLLGYFLVAPAIAGGGMDKAYAQAAEIRRLDPAKGRIAYATLRLAEKRNAEAFAEFDAVLRTAPDDLAALYQIGRCAALSGEQLDRGLAALHRCLGLPCPSADGQPSPASIHYRLGNILEKKGDPAAARREYDLANAANPDFRPLKEALKL
ncbi:MAG TPA: tetratricopeptide repeat protein [Opitutaceae bacterium]|nr:tetratricopeptide repeat protein [Opitutaceae bacterium]